MREPALIIRVGQVYQSQGGHSVTVLHLGTSRPTGQAIVVFQSICAEKPTVIEVCPIGHFAAWYSLA